MRKATTIEHQKISEKIKSKIRAEQIENGFGFGLLIFVLGAIIACLCMEEAAKIEPFRPWFIGLAVILIGFLLWLVFMIFRRFRIYSKRLKNQEYQIEDCIVEEFDFKLYPKSNQMTYYAKITDKQGNLIEENCEILNKIEFKTLDKFVNKHRNKECLYIKVGENFRFVLIPEEELATN
jgi:hypothetical protein